MLHDKAVKILTSLGELVFPSRCVACGILGLHLCEKCSNEMKPSHIKTIFPSNSGFSLIVISATSYSPIASSILLASKESHITSADSVIRELLGHSLSFFLDKYEADFLLPIPSRPSMNRKRGRSYISEIAASVGNQHCLPTISLLRHGRIVRDQSSLARSGRRNNLDGALVVEDRDRVAENSRALLIDDLVTTGATLLEAARALRYAGIEVSGGVTAFVAKPLR